MPDDATIKLRVEARKVACAAIALCMECSDECPTEDAKVAFWQAIRFAAEQHAPAQQPEKKPLVFEPMTDEESRRFEQRTIPFGMHAGRTVGYLAQYNADYLQFIAGDVRFTIDLNRYLKNAAVSRDVQAASERDEDEYQKWDFGRKGTG